jgi:hypothetical protein
MKLPGRERANLEPAAGLGRRFRLELGGGAGRHGPPVLAFELGADRLREELPDHAAENLFAGAAEKAFAGPVEVNHVPIAIEAEESFPDAVEDILGVPLRIEIRFCHRGAMHEGLGLHSSWASPLCHRGMGAGKPADRWATRPRSLKRFVITRR